MDVRKASNKCQENFPELKDVSFQIERDSKHPEQWMKMNLTMQFQTTNDDDKILQSFRVKLILYKGSRLKIVSNFSTAYSS